MINKFVIFCVFMNILNVWSSPPAVHLINKRDKFCGDKLKNALAEICLGIYNSPSKKFTQNLFYNDYEDTISGENDVNPWADFPFPEKRQRRRGTIIDECCHNSCTLRTLALYCG